MTMRIVKSFNFDAAHFLSAENDARPYERMHGHSFQMEVEIKGTPDPKYGWVADFGDVEDALADLREQLDHRLLNEIDGLALPTLENIAAWAVAKLQPKFAGLSRVTVRRPSNGEACHYDLV